MPTSLTTTDFLHLLFPLGLPAGATLEVRIDTGSGIARFWARSFTHVLDGVRPYHTSARSIWFGPGLRLGNGGYDTDVKWLSALWSDCDDKCFGVSGADADLAAERLLSFDVPPNIIVDTGHGVQGYWLLSSYAERDDLVRARNAMRALHDQLSSGADRQLDAVHNLSRMLRLPNTMNRKDSSSPRPCRVIFYNAATSAGEQLQSTSSAEPDVRDGYSDADYMRAFVESRGDSVSGWQELLAVAVQRGLSARTADALYRPDFYVKKDISALDWSVCCNLTQHLSLLDAERVWQSSPLGMRGDGNSKVQTRPDYRRQTLYRASLQTAKS